MSETWTEKEVDQINEEMACGALEAIHRLLDNGGIPRGTFADDQVRNLIAIYNKCRRLLAIERIRKVMGNEDDAHVESEIDKIHKELLKAARKPTD